MEGQNPRAGMTPFILGVVIGWVLGQIGLIGLILAGIGCGVAAYHRGYRVVIEKDHEPRNGGQNC
jgi:hypothetical protein